MRKLQALTLEEHQLVSVILLDEDPGGEDSNSSLLSTSKRSPIRGLDRQGI
jgi:hypothetical protein